ncbi:MAG: ACT domain-containing protein [Treponema sp.]|nr:ACT domain-containing protein [Treponema sp.]MBP5577724.1 ACT domain-containing protein [Treponema sp.]MBP5695496.1 ACT domain-containing protein [Treponema sp.]MBQ2354490.1 ACT domain-containing protein [Treponema sp.]MBQ2479964.1 ACT domain-containing protein [Treponema sp.]
MFIKQLSIFVENKSGKLGEVLQILSNEGINIVSASLADTNDFGVLRLLVSDAKKSYEVLKSKGITSSVNDVIGVCVPNETGGLAKVTKLILDQGINISYIYGLSVGNNTADIVMKTDDLAKTESVLKAGGVKMLEM